MNAKLLMVSVALIAVAGCNSNNGTSNTANQAAAAPVAPAAAPAAPAGAGNKASPAEEAKANVVRSPGAAEAERRLPGVWSRDADCARTMAFRGDGTMTGFDGMTGRWTVADQGGVAVLRLANDTIVATMEIKLIADDEMQWQDTPPGPDAELLALRRCG